jgi:hypothetical protein
MSKRTVQEIIKDINEAQQVYDRLSREIAVLYARYYRTNDDSLKTEINNKMIAFQKVEAQIRTLEKELK